MGINHKLKGARVEKGFSQEKLAKEIGMARLTYGQKENGIYDFTESEMSKICKVLEKEVNEIFFNK